MKANYNRISDNPVDTEVVVNINKSKNESKLQHLTPPDLIFLVVVNINKSKNESKLQRQVYLQYFQIRCCKYQ